MGCSRVLGNLVIESLANFVWEPMTQLRDTVQCIHFTGGCAITKWKKVPVAGIFYNNYRGMLEIPK